MTFLGTQTRVDLPVQGVSLQALIASEAAQALAPGSSVQVSLPPEALWLLPRTAGAA